MGPNRITWEALCDQFQRDDGLATRGSGDWAEDKLRWWHRYVDITTTAMADKPAWKDGVVYIDLFSGPGICTIRETGRRLPGSPMIAAYAPKPFRKLLLCELNALDAAACEQRLLASPAKGNFQLFIGDCNYVVRDLISAIPQDALSLAFIDPTGLHANLSTICALTKSRKIDLLILFPDAVDVLRNVDEFYFPRLDSNLDLVLGIDSGWREAWNKLGSQDGPTARRLFTTLYMEQLKKHAGYNHFGEEVIRGPKGPLYRLIFATKHERGLAFWKKVTKKERGGQKRWDFETE